MPKIQKVFTLDVSPEKFLNACSREELIELDLLLSKPIYQDKMKSTPKSEIEAFLTRENPELPKPQDECYKTGEPCLYDCPGQCRESC